MDRIGMALADGLVADAPFVISGVADPHHISSAVRGKRPNETRGLPGVRSRPESGGGPE
jgi:hypothetical protein